MNIKRYSSKNVVVQILFIMLVAFSLQGMMPATAFAQGVTVVGCSEINGKHIGDVVTLIDAIRTANRSPEEARIELTENCIYEFTDSFQQSANALPVLRTPLHIEGNGATITRRFGNTYRFIEAIDGASADNLVTLITLKNLTLSNGFAFNDIGGAILAHENVSLSLHNVTFSNNEADKGGAIATSGVLQIQDSKFIKNRADTGGAIHAADGLHIRRSDFDQNAGKVAGGAVAVIGQIPATISQSHFKENKSEIGSGGALFMNRAPLTLTESSFLSNKTGAEGGALRSNAALKLTKTTFRGNESGTDGGALYLGNPVEQIEDNSFIDNLAQNNGGAIYAKETLVLEANSMIGNHAEQNGSGLFLERSRQTSVLGNNLWADNYRNINEPGRSSLCLFCGENGQDGIFDNSAVVTQDTLANASPLREAGILVRTGTLRITNSIITHYEVGIDNQEGAVSTDYLLYSENFTTTGGDIPATDTNIIGMDPLFVSPAQRNYTLQADSPARGRASRTFSPEFDRRGVHRVFSTPPDMGAFEFDEGNIPESHRIKLSCPEEAGDNDGLLDAIVFANQQRGYNRIELSGECVYQLIRPLDSNGSSGLPLVTDSLVIEGNGATLSRDENAAPFRVLTVRDASLHMDNLTIENGLSGSGGGINVSTRDYPGEVLILTDVTLRNNRAVVGGGIHVIGSRVTLTGSRFESNTGDGPDAEGAAIFAAPSLTVHDSSFIRNTPSAISSVGQAIITGSVFQDNGKVDNSVSGNVASFVLEQSDSLLANNLWISNVGPNKTDRVIALQKRSPNATGSIDIVHNTFVNFNGVKTVAANSLRTPARLHDNIIAGFQTGINVSGSADVTSEHNLFAANVTDESAGVQSNNNIVTEKPIFVNQRADDYRLRAGSDAIDTGVDAGITIDLDGNARPSGKGFDIGAFEFIGEVE